MRTTSVVLLIIALVPAVSSSAVAGESVTQTLKAADLFGGYEAKRILLKGDALVLDTRNWRPKEQGRLVTDVIDLAGDGLLAVPATVSDFALALDAATPEGTSVTAQVRTGTTFFPTKDTWTEWFGHEEVKTPKGRYIQIRLKVRTDDPKVVPEVRGLTLSRAVTRGPTMAGTVALVEDKVQRIADSAVRFEYERPDQADLVWMRKTFKLDDVIAGKKTEFEQLKALMHWVATRPNDRHKGWHTGPYPWHIRKVLTEKDGGTVFGHCMSYCEVFITAAGALGWQGRHWAIMGFREASHEVPEVWVNELGKWVFFDPSLDTYYADPKTGEPMSILEMHNTFVNALLKDGEQLQWRGIRSNDTYAARIRALRGKHPITCVSRDYAYGKPTKWDWQWRHGYMTAGWMQLTTRNNWHSQPKPACSRFSSYPTGYCGFPVYVDEKTPVPSRRTRTWYTRKRDLWWTLNQATFRLTRSGASALTVACGNSQPFFKRYLARRDGGAWEPVDATFTWTLKSGENRLEVVPEDALGRRGIASVAVVRYSP